MEGLFKKSLSGRAGERTWDLLISFTVYYGGPWNAECGYSLLVKKILRPFGIGVVIWYILPTLVYCTKLIWQPWSGPGLKLRVSRAETSLSKPQNTP
jgi:hypothetical protein